MKLLSIRILLILKLVLLYNFLTGSSFALTLTSDRFLLKVLDRSVSVKDLRFHLRNLEALGCIYDDSFVVDYFGKKFITELKLFLNELPENDQEVRKFLHSKDKLLLNARIFLKVLRYAEDQKLDVNQQLNKLIRQTVLESKCDKEVLYKDTLKTNFISLVELELYLRSRYGAQVRAKNFESVRASLDLFFESLDKQFAHEYYW